MRLLRRQARQLLGRIFSRWPLLRSWWARHTTLVESPEVPFKRPDVSLPAGRLALVTTAGLHHPEQPPFRLSGSEGDADYRVLDLERLEAGFAISHDYYDPKGVYQDFNIVVPRDRCHELVEQGKLGGLHPRAYSFMGHILGRELERLQAETAPCLARELKAEGVQFALLTPA